MKTWHVFAWLILTAVTYYYQGDWILLWFGIGLFVGVLLVLSRRWPLFGWFLLGLFSGGRRR